MAALHSSSGAARTALERILRSRQFAGAERRKKLLEYLCEETLAGRGDALKEFNIGVEVYGRDPANYDPRLDPIVRVDIGRLRTKLSEYYEMDGRSDPVRIDLPKGSYAVDFRTREAAEPPPEATVPPKIVTAKKPYAGLLAAGLVLIALAAYGIYRWTRPSGIRSVVVLPFANLTGDAKKDYLADGITEQLTDALAHTRDLRVVARTSAFEFKHKAVDIRQIGRQLDADAVVEGSLRNMYGQYQLTVQVNRTRDGYHILSQTFEGGPQDLERLENDAVGPVLSVTHAATSAPNRKRVDPAAYDLFLKARALRGQGSVTAFQQAVTYLDEAVQRDPTYADAYAALAGVYASGAGNVASQPIPYGQKAKAAASAALRLDPRSAQAYAAEGMVDSLVFLDWKRGQEELRRAINLMPQNATSHNWLGIVLVVQGRFREALEQLRTAQNLDPLPAAPGATIGMAYYMARDYDRALHQFLTVQDLHPDTIAVVPWIGLAWEAKGDFKKAMTEYQIALAKIPSVKVSIAHLLAVSGKPTEARAMLSEIEHPESGESPNAFDVACVYAALGERDEAFRWLDRAYDDRNIWAIKVHPMLDPLRKDARFAQLLKKTGLAN